MSLYLLDENPRRLAEALRNSDLQKARETLASAVCDVALQFDARADVPNPIDDAAPKPLTQWISASRSNWQEATEMLIAINSECVIRIGKPDEKVRKVISFARSDIPYNMPELGLQRLPYFAEDEFTDYHKNPVEIWRFQFVDDLTDEDDWGARNIPDWIEPTLKTLIAARKNKIK